MRTDTLDIRITGIGPSLCVTLSGELDLYSSASLAPLLVEVNEGDAQDIALDLTGLQYIDSTGLMQIVRVYRTTRGRSRSFTVHVREGSIVQRVLRLIGAGDLFPIVVEPATVGSSSYGPARPTDLPHD